MTVPFLDLARQFSGISLEIDEAVRGVLRSQSFILGPEVEDLVERLHTVARHRHLRPAVEAGSIST